MKKVPLVITIAKLAEADDRSIGAMIRTLLKEALAARGVHIQDKN